MAEFTLTPQQQVAVEHEGSALLVSAAAGSGKTKVLVERVMRRLCDPVDPKDITSFLMITYTKAAATELRGKLAAAIGEALAANPAQRHLQRQLSHIALAQISTVHSFCTGLLRDYAHELGLYPDFRVAEEQESGQLREQALAQTFAEVYGALDRMPECAAFLEHLGAGRDDRTAAAILMQAYRSVRCQPDPQRWVDDCRAQLTPAGGMEDTPWGKLLLSSFREQLAEQLTAMEEGLSRLTELPAVAEAYAPTYEANIAQLRCLLDAPDWDALYARRVPDFGRLKAVRGVDSEVLAFYKRPRQQCWDWLKKAQGVFSMPSSAATQELRQGAPAILGMFTLLERLLANDKALKQRRRVLDFGDLEHETLRLLCKPGSGAPTAAAREISQRYCEILVDEYQDSNAVQDRIFAAVSRNGANLFFVGDVKQSIYRFRLADPGIFLEKYHRFTDAASAAPGQPARVVLSKNFRSRPQILAAVNDIFRLTMTEAIGDLRYGPDEALYPGAALPPSDDPCVELHCLDTEGKDADDSRRSLEARLVAQRVAELLAGDTEPEDIVILLRSLRSQAGDFLQALREQGIPAFSDQEDNILSATEVQVLLSYLQVLDNPHQDIPLLSVLLSPVFGVSAQQLAQVRARCRAGDLYDALHGEDAFAPFLTQLTALRQTARQESAGVLVRLVCEQTGLRDVFSAMDGGEQRLENLQTIYLLAAAFDPDGPGRLHDFLQSIERQRERGISGAGARHVGAVRLMSIHKSKGLEFPVVIVAGLSTRFNTADERQPLQVHPRLGVGCDVVDLERRLKYPSLAKQAILAQLAQERLSEELRVLYVALTRPKLRLIMTYASAHLRTQLRSISEQLRPDGPIALSRQAGSIGHWVLMAAMCRPEAQPLFALAGNQPDALLPSKDPWHIRLWTPDELSCAEAIPTAPEKAPAATVETLPPPLQYPHLCATTAPAKLTATQCKGRFLDTESTEHAPSREVREPTLRQPLFLRGQRALTRAEAGTAMHLAMQYIRYDRCGSEEGVAAELRRLVDEGFLLEQQAKVIPTARIAALFASPLGQRILYAPEVVREFKFSLLVDGSEYDPALAGEQLLLQGVTDCCLLEDDGLCVIDFKTDRVSPSQLDGRVAVYRGQLEAYSRALRQIFERPVKEKLLYFFSLDEAVRL